MNAYREKIKDLIDKEVLLLPDFQRDFVWTPNKQQSKLICSLFLDIPIGSILIIDKLKKIGVRQLCYKEEVHIPKQYKLLLDGQQRISTIKSVFSNLYDNKYIGDWKSIHEKLHKNLKYRWFLNVSLEGIKGDDLKNKLNLLYELYWNKKFNEDYDIEDIESIIVNKKVLSKRKRWHPSHKMDIVKNYCNEKSYIPLFMILSNDGSLVEDIVEEISKKYINFLIREKNNNNTVKEHIKKIEENHNEKIEKESLERISKKLRSNVIGRDGFFNNCIVNKEIYGVKYEFSNLNKAIVTFNTMNTGGISLGVFDILSAKYSKLNKGRLSETLLDYAKIFIGKIDDESLADLIDKKFVKDAKYFVTKEFSDMYLSMLSIFIEDNKNNEFKLDSIKQKNLLEIKAEDIEKHSKKVVESLILAFQFLVKKCGVPSIKDIKYKLTIIPIAYNLYKYKNKVEDKIEYSYWMSLFSGKYEKGQNAFSIEHLNQLIKFVNNTEQNKFKEYENDLCNKKGYSDWEGFSSFYEDNSYSYSKSIGEYFLQFILKISCNINIFIKQGEEIKIEHFTDLHKDHIIPSSWINSSKKNSPVHSVLNQFYSTKKRNQKRGNNPITEQIKTTSMKVLCIDQTFTYTKEEFSSEEKLKKYLESRFKLFKKRIEKHLEDLLKKIK